MEAEAEAGSVVVIGDEARSRRYQEMGGTVLGYLLYVSSYSMAGCCLGV